MEIITAYKDLLIIASLFVVTAVLIYMYWEKIEFWWLNTTYSFPIIGKMSALKKNHQVKENGVFLSEEQLCNDYIIHYNKFKKDGSVYSRAQDYLDLLGEKKRKPMTLIIWLFIIALVVVEALGFAYVLSGYAVPGASEEVKQYGAYGIGALISVILVYLTHKTGHIFYDNSMIKKIRIWWRQDQNNPNRPLLMPKDGIGLENHNDDAKDPIYIRFLSRIPTNATVTPSYIVPIITAIFVILVAVGSTYVRGEVMAQEMIEEKSAKTTSRTVQTNAWGETPSALQADQSAADMKVAQESQEHFENGAWGAFIVLAIIFVFLQIFGILLGFNRGFAGEDSDIAYETVNGFSSREEFEHHYDHKRQYISKVAQAKLQELQQEMRELLDSGSSNAPTTHRPTITFHQFVVAHKHNKLQVEQQENTLQDEHDQVEEDREIAAHKAKIKKLRDQKARMEEMRKLEEEIAAAAKIDTDNGDKV